MKEVTYKLNVETKGAVKEVDELNDSIKNTGKDAKSTQDVLNTISGGAVNRFGALKGKITGVIKSFKSLRVAVIASGIGALLVAVVALQQAFTRSEAGQNKFAKLMGIIGSVVNNLLDLLADLGEALIYAFENPKEALTSFINLLKEQVVNRFTGLLELIPKLGKAINLLFKGEFSEAGKVAGNAVGKVVLGVENVVEKTQAAINKTKEFVKELEEEAKVAAKIADDRAKADKIERENTVARAKADREIADLRFKAEQRDKFAVSERIKFLEQASALEEEITNQEIEAARLRFEAKKAENELSKSTKEDLDEQAQLEAQLIGLNTSKLRLQKRLQTSLTTFRNEEKAERAAALKAEEDAQKAEQKRIEEKEKAEAAAREKKKLEQSKADNEEAIRAEEQYNLLQKLRNTAEEQELFELQQQFDAKMLLAEGNAELELALTDKFFKDSQAIEDKYAKEAKLKRDANDKKDAENAQRLQDLKVEAALTGLNTIASLTRTFAGESEEQQKRAFNINKAVGIASTLVQTFQSAQGAYLSQLSIPSPDAPIRAKIAAGIATATGLANVAAIAAQKFKAPSKQKPSEEEGGGGLTSPTQPPSFNVVGASGFNQVAGALGQQQPLQAYVVAGDVTTAQQLQNNTIQQATF